VRSRRGRERETESAYSSQGNSSESKDRQSTLKEKESSLLRWEIKHFPSCDGRVLDLSFELWTVGQGEERERYRERETERDRERERERDRERETERQRERERERERQRERDRDREERERQKRERGTDLVDSPLHHQIQSFPTRERWHFVLVSKIVTSRWPKARGVQQRPPEREKRRVTHKTSGWQREPERESGTLGR
jgi:hypothetical protein